MHLIRPSITYHSSTRRPLTVVRKLPSRRLTVQTKAFIDWEFQSYIIGKGIIAFVLCYTTMNWWYYKRTREDLEQKEKEKEKEKEKNKNK